MSDWYDEAFTWEFDDDFYGDEDQNEIMRIINSYVGPAELPGLPDTEDDPLLFDTDELPF